VDIALDVDRSYMFYIRRWKYWDFVGDLTGYLEYQSENSTKVSAEARIATYQAIFHRFMIPVSVAVPVGVLNSGEIGGFLFFLLWLCVLIFNWYRLNRWRDELLLCVQGALG
jgi:hypothetical protein